MSEDRKQTDPVMQWVTFCLGDEKYGINVMQVQEVSRFLSSSDFSQNSRYFDIFRFSLVFIMGSILSKSYYLNIVRQTLISENMIQPDDAVILAVSGGPDSVALTHIMFQLKEEFSCRLVIAHLDHCLRNESRQDFEFVKGLAESLGVGSWKTF